MMTPQISAATRLPVTILEWDDTSPFDGDAVYSAFGLDANAANWARIFAADPTDAICALFLPHVEKSLVVGFEISPLLQKILNCLDIPFVDIRWHPLRFLDDIFFGFSSNRSEISAAIASYALSGQEVDFHVGLHKAAAIRRSAFNKKGPSCETLIVGRTPFDASLIHDGRIATFLDQEDKIAELAKTGSIAFRPHPFSPHPSPSLAAFLEHHGRADIFRSTLERTWPNGNPIPFKPDRLRHVNGSYCGLLNTGGLNLVMSYNTPE
jgi:hypothetical protein